MTYNSVDLCGEIDDELAKTVCRQLKEASRFSEEVILYIDSPGGFSEPMWQIIKAIKSLGVPVWGYVIGQGESAAFNILQYCTLRLVSPYVSLLFHRGRYTPGDNPEFATLFWGEPYVFASETTEDIELYSLMAKKSALPVEQIQHLATTEFNPSPEEALVLGFIDAILR